MHARSKRARHAAKNSNKCYGNSSGLLHRVTLPSSLLQLQPILAFSCTWLGLNIRDNGGSYNAPRWFLAAFLFFFQYFGDGGTACTLVIRHGYSSEFVCLECTNWVRHIWLSVRAVCLSVCLFVCLSVKLMTDKTAKKSHHSLSATAKPQELRIINVPISSFEWVACSCLFKLVVVGLIRLPKVWG